MQAADFKKYVENPQLLNKQSIRELQLLVKDFPYFQSAHILLSLASKKWDASLYQQSLKKTAIVVTNRAHLFSLIHKLEQPEVPVISVVEDKKEVPVSIEQEVSKQEEIIQQEVQIVVEPIITAQATNTEHENTKHELEILKAVEIATEPAVEAKADETEFLEKEIGKQVVNSFVEKEILKTPELHHPEQKSEPENFGDWLAMMKQNIGQIQESLKEKTVEEKVKTELSKKEAETKKADEVELKKQRQWAIIDKIIEENPGKIRVKDEPKFFAAEQKAKESLLENEHLVTETLAKIYALQGSVNKAIRAYEILSLRFPQKSAYFATLIKKLKHNS